MPSPTSSAPPSEPAEWLRRRAARTWQWPLSAALMLALELAFILWINWNYVYISGCWEVMREMEMGALQVAPGQSLSLTMPVWLSLGAIAYTLGILMILRFWRLERRYLKLLRQRTPTPD